MSRTKTTTSHTVKREDFGGLMGQEIWNGLVDDAIEAGDLDPKSAWRPDLELDIRYAGRNA